MCVVCSSLLLLALLLSLSIPISQPADSGSIRGTWIDALELFELLICHFRAVFIKNDGMVL